LHAAGKLVWAAACESDESDHLERRAHPALCFLTANSERLERELDVAFNGTPIQQCRMLKHHRDLVEAQTFAAPLRPGRNRNGPRRRPEQICHHSERRALAASGRADQRDHFALPDFEADVVHRIDLLRAPAVLHNHVLEMHREAG